MNIRATITDLRRLIPDVAVLPRQAVAAAPLGLPELDALLGGGLRAGALHEVYAATPADSGAGAGFALGLARLLRPDGRTPLLWLRQSPTEREFGRPHAPGLAEMGIDPRRLVLATARRGPDLLDAALQAMRGLKAGVVLLEPWGAARELDLTASRRLALAAEASAGGVTLIALFAGREPTPSPALTRWRIAAAPATAGPRALMGRPRLRAELIRHRSGRTGEWVVEWMSDACVFRGSCESPERALPRPAPSLPADGPAAADHGGIRRRAG
jgi:protein ImuA